MNIGLVSYEFKNHDLAFNIRQIKKALRAVGDKVDLLCFGESFLQGFDSLSWSFTVDKKVAVSMDSEAMKSICLLTKEYDCALAFGYFELFEEAIYSSYVIIEDGEIIHNYRRVTTGWKESSLTDEHYKEGNEINEFIFKDQKFMIGLCGDLWEDPDKFKTDGILIWPVYVNFTLDQWKDEKIEYAKQIKDVAGTVLMINSISKDPDSVGGAFIFNNGELVNEVIFEVENITVIGV